MASRLHTLNSSRRTVAAGLLVATTAIAATPACGVIGFTVPLDTDHSISIPSYGDQIDGDLARGNGRTLVVWNDQRTGGISGAGQDIFGQIVLDDGTVIFSGSLEIVRDGTRNLNIPRVTWNGTHWLVCWSDDSAAHGATRATRVAPDGTVLDPDGFVVDASTRFMQSDVASDGTDFLVASLSAGVAQERIEVRRVAADGTLIDTTPIIVRPTGAPAILRQVRVTFVDGVYVLVWEDAERIRSARVAPDGTVLDPGGTEITTDVSYWPSIETNGTSCFVTWTEFREESAANLGGTVLDPASLSTTGMIQLTDANELGGHGAGELCWSDDRYLVLVDRGEPIFGAAVDLWGLEVSAAGAPMTEVFPIATTEAASQYAKGAVAIDGGFFVAYEDYREGGGFQGIGMYGARVMFGGTVLEPDGIALSLSMPWQTTTTLVSDGTQFLAFWEELRGGPETNWRRDLYMGRMNLDGTPTGAPTQLVAENEGWVRIPDAAGGDGQTVVVWEENTTPSRVRFARVLADGTVLDPGGIVLAEGPSNAVLIRPRVAYADGHWFIVWHRSSGLINEIGANGCIIDAEGAFVVPPFQITRDANQTGFDVAAGPSGFAFSTTYNGFGGPHVKLRRFDHDGTFRGTHTLASDTGTTSRVVHDGTGWTVMWTIGAGINRTIRGARVSDAGVIAHAATSISTGSRGVADLAAADGRLFAMHFNDGGDALPGGLRLHDIDVATLTVNETTVIDAMHIDDLYHAGTLTAHGSMLVAGYPRWSAMPVNASRAHGHFVDVAPGIVGDVDGDGTVAFSDLLLVLGDWGACAGCPADLDGDGVVGFADVLIVLSAWS